MDTKRPPRPSGVPDIVTSDVAIIDIHAAGR